MNGPDKTSSKRSYHRHLKVLFKLAVTILFAYLVFRKVDLAETKNIFLRSDLRYLLAGLLIYLCSYLVSNRRSLLYLAGIDIRLGYLEGLRLYLEGTVYNLILPGGIGGDGYKIYALRKSTGVAATSIFRAFFFERLSGLWAICLVLACLSLLMPQSQLEPFWVPSAFVAGSLAYYIVMRRFFPAYSGSFAQTHLLSIGIQCLVMACVACILRAQALDVPYAPYLFSFQGSTIFSILNIGLSGLGVREFAMSYASSFLSTDPVISVFVASTFWLLSTLASLPGLWSLLRKDRESLRKAHLAPPEDADTRDRMDPS